MKKDKWIWMPHEGHLCVGYLCRFKLNTYVGKYIVSTVGEYYPHYGTEMETLGIGEKDFYETMIFKSTRDLKNKCCPYSATGNELDCIRYSNAVSAYKGHLRACNKFSKL